MDAYEKDPDIYQEAEMEADLDDKSIDEANIGGEDVGAQA